MTTTVNCPTCGRPVRWEAASTWRPFCCERCRLIDLGDWLDENHRIPDPSGAQSDEWPDAQAADWGEASDASGDALGDPIGDHLSRH